MAKKSTTKSTTKTTTKTTTKLANSLAITTTSPATDKPELRIGLIGYGFMGRAHANAIRQVPHFFKTGRKPVLQAVAMARFGPLKPQRIET